LNQWRLIIDEPGDAAWNMAVDEAILRACERGDAPPTLRFYGWSPPAVSVGYFQDVAREVDVDYCRRKGWPVVRRLTGGRAVLHADELTYSVVAPTDHPLFPKDISGTYHVIARGLLAGLHHLGVKAEMVSCREKGAARDGVRSAACFSAPSWYELIVDGKKLAGSAQRRLANSFLQHGSLLLGLDIREQCGVLKNGESMERRLAEKMTAIGSVKGAPVTWHETVEALRKGFEEALGIVFEIGGLSVREEEDIYALEQSRYGSKEWNINNPQGKGFR